MPSYTFDANLPTDMDWVRELIRDVYIFTAPGPILSDEEIQAYIDKQTSPSPACRYYAAAEALGALHTQWMTSGRGKTSKKVSKLQTVYGTGSGINVDLALQARVKELRIEGARLCSARPYPFRMV